MTGAPKKTRKVVQPVVEEEHQSDDSDSYHGPQEIQATFEGRNPEGQDFESIKQLLKQLFVSADIDLSPISDMIISQAGIGSVLKQSCNDSDDEEDMEMVEESDVYGVTTVLNLTQNKESPWVQQLYQLIDEESSKISDESTKASFKQILQNDKVGLLLNERFLNIPSTISSFMLGSLQKEVARMKRKNDAYNFQYFIMFIKLWRAKDDKTSPPTFANDEEDLFNKQAEYHFDYSVEAKSDTGLAGNWESEDTELVPYRRVILFKSDKFDSIINEVKDFVDTKSINIIF